MSKSILVTGFNGQLGSEFQALAHLYSDFDFTFAERDTLDLSSTATIEAFFEKRDFDLIINCAAYTAVDKAESDEGDIPEAAGIVSDDDAAAGDEEEDAAPSVRRDQLIGGAGVEWIPPKVKDPSDKFGKPPF